MATPVSSSPLFICSWRLGRFGSLWVDLAGELDLSACPGLERTLEEAQILSSLIVLDMRELTSMDSAGAHVIIDASISARRAGLGLIVARGPTQVDEVFTLTGTPEQVELFDLDREECPPAHNGGPPVPRPARAPPRRSWRKCESRPPPDTPRQDPPAEVCCTSDTDVNPNACLCVNRFSYFKDTGGMPAHARSAQG
jgi:anti-anti-sigma factor